MNKWMKVACVVVAVGAGATGVKMAWAQETTGTEQREGRRGGRGERGNRGGIAGIALQLKDITPEQKSKLEALQKEQQEQMRARFQQTTGTATANTDREAMREQWRKAAQEQRTKVDAILTDAQKTELTEKLSTMRGGQGNGRRGGQRDQGNE